MLYTGSIQPVVSVANIELCCLDEGILRLARQTWNNILFLHDSQDPGADRILLTDNLLYGSMDV